MPRPHCLRIRAPLPKIFLAAADLTRWPEFLSHYRHNRFLSQTPSGGVVKMTGRHAGIPLSWVSQFRIDARRHELRFTHLRSTLRATDGTETLWTFEERPDGDVEVTVTHHPAAAWPVVGRLAPNKALGQFLLGHLTEKTLAGLKRKVEAPQHAEKSRVVSSRSPRKTRATKTSKPRRKSPRKSPAARVARAKPLRKRK